MATDAADARCSPVRTSNPVASSLQVDIQDDHVQPLLDVTILREEGRT